MRRLLLLTALSALLCGQANAQVPVVSKVLPKITVGIKAGANFQTLSGDVWKNSYKTGIVGGAFVGLTKGKWGIQAEALVKSARFDIDGFSDAYIKTLNLDIPVMFQYKIISRLWVQAGPQFSSVLSAKDKDNDDVKKNFTTTDISGVLGLELRLPLHLTAGARYILGFSDVNNHDETAISEAWRNRYAQVYVGFRFL